MRHHCFPISLSYTVPHNSVIHSLPKGTPCIIKPIVVFFITPSIFARWRAKTRVFLQLNNYVYKKEWEYVKCDPDAGRFDPTPAISETSSSTLYYKITCLTFVKTGASCRPTFD